MKKHIFSFLVLLIANGMEAKFWQRGKIAAFLGFKKRRGCANGQCQVRRPAVRVVQRNVYVPVAKKVVYRKKAVAAPAPVVKRLKVQVPQALNQAEQFARATLHYTNQYRAKRGLPALQWDQNIADIGYRHSASMGTNKVPFGHANFQQRINGLSRPYRAAAENVFMGNVPGDKAQIAVDGWIKSPGHHKNLVGDFTHCGIGVYCNAQGYWYFTQIFARYW